MEYSLETIAQILKYALNYAEVRNYKGSDKFDALNSPFSKIIVNSKLLKIVFTQIIARSPINLRPIFRIPKEKNPKGIGLFAHTYANLYDITGDINFREKMDKCLEWLLQYPSPGTYGGLCWGYNMPWQSSLFFVPRYGPNAIVSTAIGQAMLRAYEVTNESRYLECATSIIGFIRKDLHKQFDDSGLYGYSYTPYDRTMVINVSALIAGFMIRLYKYVPQVDLLEESRKLMQFVVSKQTDYGAWFYMHPHTSSYLKHDNYHTGYILDSLLQYLIVSGDQQWLDAYNQGIEFYSSKLFRDGYIPKYQHNQIYPIDIHGASQGIITFSLASQVNTAYRHQALLVASWTLSNMLANDGHFYFQHSRFIIKRYPLMRWAQAWMCLALSDLLLVLNGKPVN
ncbi:MAG: hypothetical protein C3F13_06580 [Anaerolineales bacterium]|nr:MAG: hypothetical protein C3F13_06580 [Anaerolineales bacterium]